MKLGNRIFCPACKAENIESNDHDYEDACLCHKHTIESVDDATKTEHRFLNAIARAEKAEAERDKWKAVIREYMAILEEKRKKTIESLEEYDQPIWTKEELLTKEELKTTINLVAELSIAVYDIAQRHGLEVE